MSVKTLILIAVLVLLSMLNNWWKRRQQGREEEPPDWPGQSPKSQPRPPSAQPPVRPPQRQPASWEEELRRLLQGESPATPPAVPPPPVRVPPPLPVPPPIPSVRAPRPVPSARVTSRVPAGGDPDMERGLPVQMPTLAHSAQAYLRASQLGSKVADHMRRVEERVAAHKPVQASRQTSAAVRQAIGLVRQRSSQQTAILAGVILGPPRSLEM